MRRYLFLASLLLTNPAYAGNGFKSQFSHFLGGLLIVVLVAYIVRKYLPAHKPKSVLIPKGVVIPNSVLIGFYVSLSYVVIDQTLDYLKYGKLFNQLLDFGSHLLGALLALAVGIYLFKKS